MSTIINGHPALRPLTGAVPGSQGTQGTSLATGTQSTSSVFGAGGSFSQLVMALEQSGATASTAGAAATNASSATASGTAAASASGSPQLQQAVQNFLTTLKQSLSAQSSSPTAAAGAASSPQNSTAPVRSGHHGHHHGGGGSSLLASLMNGDTDLTGSASATSSLAGTANIPATSWQTQAQKSSAAAMAAAHGRLLGVV
jgi:hypothetical protein